jgi:hypothetical protein
MVFHLLETGRDVHLADVRFEAHYGLKSDIAERSKSAMKRLMHRSNR